MICRWYQFRIHRAIDDGRTPDVGVQRHVEHCANCRAVLEQQRALAEQLVNNSTAREPAPVPPFLHARILNEIRATRPAAQSSSRLRWVGTAIATIALAAAVFAMLPTNPQPVETLVHQTTSTEPKPVQSIAWIESTANLTSGGNWLKTTAHIDQPLEAEMNRVIGDARTAMRSLREELLPTQLLAKSD